MRPFPILHIPALARIFERFSARAKQRAFDRKVRKVSTSRYFDAAHYLARYPDVEASGMDPARHYVLHGGLEGRNPSALFDSNAYLEHHPEVKARGMNPLLHFIDAGERRGAPDAAPIPWLPGARQEASLPGDPLQPMSPAPPDVGRNDDADPSGADAGQRMMEERVRRIRASAYFDAAYYLTMHPDVKASGMDPASHYYLSGALEGRNPSLNFNTNAYLGRYPEVKALGLNPLLHFIDAGERMDVSEGEGSPRPPTDLRDASIPDGTMEWLYPVQLPSGHHEGTVRVTSYDASIKRRPHGEAIAHWEPAIQAFWKTYIDRYYEFFILPERMQPGEILDVGAEFYNKYVKEVIAAGQRLTVVDLKEPDHPDIRIVQGLDAYERFDMTVDDHRDFPRLSGRFDTALSFGVLSYYDIPPDKCIRYLENLAGFLKPDGLAVMKIDLSVIQRHQLFPAFPDLHCMIMDRFTMERIDLLNGDGQSFQIYFGRKKQAWSGHTPA